MFGPIRLRHENTAISFYLYDPLPVFYQKRLSDFEISGNTTRTSRQTQLCNLTLHFSFQAYSTSQQSMWSCCEIVGYYELKNLLVLPSRLKKKSRDFVIGQGRFCRLFEDFEIFFFRKHFPRTVFESYWVHGTHLCCSLWCPWAAMSSIPRYRTTPQRETTHSFFRTEKTWPASKLCIFRVLLLTRHAVNIAWHIKKLLLLCFCLDTLSREEETTKSSWLIQSTYSACAFHGSHQTVSYTYVILLFAVSQRISLLFCQRALVWLVRGTPKPTYIILSTPKSFLHLSS